MDEHQAKALKRTIKWSEILGGICGWAWFGGIIVWLYFLVRAIFFDGRWLYFFIAFVISGFVKALARQYNAQGQSAAFVYNMMTWGFTFDEANTLLANRPKIDALIVGREMDNKQALKQISLELFGRAPHAIK